MFPSALCESPNLFGHPQNSSELHEKFSQKMLHSQCTISIGGSTLKGSPRTTEVFIRPVWQRPREQRHPNYDTMPYRRRDATRHTCRQVHICQPALVSSRHGDKKGTGPTFSHRASPALELGEKCRAASGPSRQPQNLLRQPQNCARQQRHIFTRPLIA